MTSYDWLEPYLLSLPGAEHDFKVEWSWDRYMVRGKLFAALCKPQGMKDEQYNDHVLVNLKCDPGRSELLRAEFPDILPGFYCDKRTWIVLTLGLWWESTLIAIFAVFLAVPSFFFGL